MSVDFLVAIGAGVAALYGSPVAHNVVGNRIDRGIDFVVTRLTGSATEAELDSELAFAAWWSCLQVGMLACTRLIDAGEAADADRQQADLLRKHLGSELGALERNRHRYFRQRMRGAGGATDLSPADVRSSLLRPDALATGFVEWMESELARLVADPAPGLPNALSALLDADSFRAEFEIYLAEAFEVMSEASRRGRRMDPLERLTRYQLSRLGASTEEVRRDAAATAQHAERRAEADRLAALAAGRNAGILVEERIEELMCRPFVGRAGAIAELNRALREEDAASILISAPAGYGKSSLLAHWLRGEGSLWGHVAYHFVDVQRGPDVSTRARVFANLLGQMLPHFGLALDPSREAEGQVGALLDGGFAPPRDERLIVLIDGLDEITDWGSTGPTLLLRDSLPPGVFVIASVRSGPADPSLTRNWSYDREIRLDVLPDEAIPEALSAHGEGELASHADDPDVIEWLRTTTGGVPLYLKFTLDVLAEGGASRGPVVASDATPETRFATFLRGHFQHLHRVIPDLTDQPEYRLLQLLVAAGMPLHEDDLALLGIDPLALGDLRVMRWVSGPASGMYSLPHQFLGVALTEAFGPAVMAAAEDRLRGLAEAWAETPSPYAARSYAPLLEERIRAAGKEADGARERLLALVADNGFTEVQERLAGDDLLLPLRTVAAAAAVAVESGETVVATELALRGLELRRRLESPTAALRPGTPVGRLIELVSALDVDAQGPWEAFVELALAEERPDDRADFRAWRESSRQAGRDGSWEAETGIDQTLVYLALRMGELELAEDVAGRFRDGRYEASALAMTAAALSRRGRSERAERLAGRAREIAAGLSPADMRSPWLVTVSRWLAAGGLEHEMRQSAREACRLATTSPGTGSTYALAEAARWAARLGETAIATETARRALEHTDGGLEDVAGIAEALARAGEMSEARALVRTALAKVKGSDWSDRRRAAEALAACGGIDEARETARRALTVAHGLSGERKLVALFGVAKTLTALGEDGRANEVWLSAAEHVRGALGGETPTMLRLAGELARAGERRAAAAALAEARASLAANEGGNPSFMLGNVATVLLDLDRIEEALEVASGIPLPQIRSGELASVAGAMAQERASREALPVVAMAIEARHRFEKPRVLPDVADAFVVGGHFREAVLVARSIDDHGQRASALAGIGVAAARAGDGGWAFELAEEALAATRNHDGTSLFHRDAHPAIAEALALCGKVEGALRLAESPSPYTASRVLGRVAEVLAATGRPDLAAEIAAEAVARAEGAASLPTDSGLRFGIKPETPEAAVLLAAARAFAGAERGRLARMVWTDRARTWQSRSRNWGLPYFLDSEAGEALGLIADSEGPEAAFALLEEIEEPTLRARIAVDASRSLAENDGTAVKALVDRAFEMACSEDEAARIFVSGARALALSGDRGAAVRAIDAAGRRAWPNEGTRGALLTVELAEALIAAGEDGDAVAVARDALDPLPGSLGSSRRARLGDRAAAVLGAAGREDVATAAARSLRTPIARAQLLTATARGLAAAGHNARSFAVAHEAIAEAR